MKALLLDIINDQVKEVEIIREGQERLKEYYKLLICDIIDIVSRRIGKLRVDIICDDEGLLRENPKISAINNMGEAMLVGNLLFVKNDGEGGTIALEDSEIEYIKKHIQKMYTHKYPEGYMMLTQCEW